MAEAEVAETCNHRAFPIVAEVMVVEVAMVATEAVVAVLEVEEEVVHHLLRSGLPLSRYIDLSVNIAQAKWQNQHCEPKCPQHRRAVIHWRCDC